MHFDEVGTRHPFGLIFPNSRGMMEQGHCQVIVRNQVLFGTYHLQVVHVVLVVVSALVPHPFVEYFHGNLVEALSGAAGPCFW